LKPFTRSPPGNLTGQEYDITENYDYIRATGSIPIIDYNPRNENLSKQALIDRGYDHNGPVPLENMPKTM